MGVVGTPVDCGLRGGVLEHFPAHFTRDASTNNKGFAEYQGRCSEREPADSLRDKYNVIGGWLPSLTSR